MPWLIVDLNGEPHRATEWGYAMVRLRASFAAFAEPRVWYTAASFGDVGAASALIGICLSVRSWERDYAPGESAVVASVSDGEARAAVAILRS
jgi:3-oxoacyl-[acyl-carrier-protein] synthase-1